MSKRAPAVRTVLRQSVGVLTVSVWTRSGHQVVFAIFMFLIRSSLGVGIYRLGNSIFIASLLLKGKVVVARNQSFPLTTAGLCRQGALFAT